MYITGIGFHTNCAQLLTAAYIWRTVRTVRLARARHAKLLSDGSARINLASLPNEVYQAIEDRIVELEYLLVGSREPFEFDDSCCLRAIDDMHDSEVYEEALLDFAMEQDYDIRHRQGWRAAISHYMTTGEYANFVQEALDNHENEGACAKARNNFYFCTAFRDGPPYQNLVLQELVRPFTIDSTTHFGLMHKIPLQVEHSEEAIEKFTDDHHLRLIRGTVSDRGRDYF